MDIMVYYFNPRGVGTLICFGHEQCTTAWLFETVGILLPAMSLELC